MFCDIGGCPSPNELVIRVQPDEAINLRIVSKAPGRDLALEARDLDLRDNAAAPREIPEAYENLLVDVMRGDKSLFIRSDELQAAWDIFTPVLHEIDRLRLKPEPYAFLSTGPGCAASLAAKHDVVCGRA
jgi:glucose-6-phosphate 1-dehydrogenase